MLASDAHAALRAVAEHGSALPVMRDVGLPARDPSMRGPQLLARHPVMWPDDTSVEPSHARLLFPPDHDRLTWRDGQKPRRWRFDECWLRMRTPRCARSPSMARHYR
jgi:hypothetical protein